MYKVGAISGKFLPPQMGHAELISQAADACETLYVVVSDRNFEIPVELRIEWLAEYFKNRNIIFLPMDETAIPPRPDGTAEWCEVFKKIIGEKIDARFFGEEAYFQMDKYFPGTKSVMIQRDEINATQIRANPKKYLHQIIPPARKYFM